MLTFALVSLFHIAPSPEVVTRPDGRIALAHGVLSAPATGDLQQAALQFALSRKDELGLGPGSTLVPGDTTFETPATPGVARITVDVQSLFDGSFSTLEQDEGFTLALDATVRPDGSIAIQLR